MSVWRITPPPPAPRVAGRYVLGRLIGQGTYSAVWQACDLLTRNAVAVKAIRLPDALGDERDAVSGGLLRAVRAAGRLVHPGAAAVLSEREEDGVIWVASQLVPARTMWELLAHEGPLPARRAAAIGVQVLAALRAAHHHGIVHHDVQPGNVLVQPDGRARLVDFGGEHLKSSRQLAANRASPAVLPPPPTHGPEADLRGLGATLLCAVSGHPPHPAAAVTRDAAGDLAPVIRSLLAATAYARPDGTALLGRLVAVATGSDRAPRPLGRPPAMIGARSRRPADPPGREDPEPERAGGDPGPRPGPATAAAGTGTAVGTRAARSARRTGAAAWLRDRPRVVRRAAVLLVIALLTGLVALGAWLGLGGQRVTATAVATVSAVRPGGITPTGWQEHTAEAAGVTVAVPAGWRRVEGAAGELLLEDPRSGAAATVTTVAGPPGDAGQAARAAERDARAPGYRRVRLAPVRHLGRPAFLWERELTGGGRTVHAADLHVRMGERVVVLSFRTAAADWADAQRARRGFTGSVRPA